MSGTLDISGIATFESAVNAKEAVAMTKSLTVGTNLDVSGGTTLEAH